MVSCTEETPTGKRFVTEGSRTNEREREKRQDGNEMEGLIGGKRKKEKER